MSGNLLNLAARASVGDPYEKVVLMVLAEAANAQTGQTFVGQDTIAERCIMSPRAVVNVMRRLEAAGLITRQKRYGEKGHRTSDLVTLLLTAPGALRDESLSAPDDKAYMHRVQGNPKTNPQIKDNTVLASEALPQSPSQPKATTRAKTPNDPAFESLWIAYPHFPGRSDKAASFRFWSTMPADDRGDLVSAVCAFADSAQAKKDEGQFVAAFDRWLRKGQWRDFVTTAQAAASPPPTIDWQARVERFRTGGVWPASWGEKPGRSGCAVPADVLASHGYGAPALKLIDGGLP